MTFGEKVKARRVELKMTQEELARKCGWNNRSSISQIEKDLRDVATDKIQTLANVLQVDPTYFFDFSRSISPIELEVRVRMHTLDEKQQERVLNYIIEMKGDKK